MLTTLSPSKHLCSYFKCNIEMSLDVYVSVLMCKKRETGNIAPRKLITFSISMLQLILMDNMKPPCMLDPGSNLTRDKHVWDM